MEEPRQRSLFSNRSLHLNSSLSSRRPSFNASTFGSPSFIDKTLSTKQILNSPFYSGNTIYGGASAYGRKLFKSADDIISSKASIQMKPTINRTSNKTTGLSKTARKILSVMEQYNTPINDAKKIPTTPRRQGILSKYIGATPYILGEKKNYNTELQIPTVPDLLLMKQKEKLQNSTESVRQMANSSSSNLNKEEYKIRSDDDVKPHSSKMKSSVSSTRKKSRNLETVSEVNLAKVALPITTLPKFDLLFKPTSTVNEKNNNIEKNEVVTNLTKTENITRTIEPKNSSVEDKKTERSNTFVFSHPLIISSSSKPSLAINCFKFSEPLCKKQSLAESNKTQFQKEDMSFSKGFGDQFKLSNNWECSSCLVRNSPSHSSCVACTATRSNTIGKLPATGFGNAFKPSTLTWECSTCLIRNNVDLDKCQACGSSKGPTESASNLSNNVKITEPAVQKLSTVELPKTQFNAKDVVTSEGFGNQFKLADKWECNSCLVRNLQSDTNCAACTTPRANTHTHLSDVGFGNKFKPTNSTWECSTCLIRNSIDLDKCQACETAKICLGTSLNNFGNQFKPSPSTWECSVCLIRNQNNLDLCEACGSPRKSANTDKVQDKSKDISFFPSSPSSSVIFNKVIPPEPSINKTLAVSNNSKVESSSSPAFTVPTIDSYRNNMNNSLTKTEVNNSKDVIFGVESKKTENLFSSSRVKESSNIFNSAVNTPSSIIFGGTNLSTTRNDKLSTTSVNSPLTTPTNAKMDSTVSMFSRKFESPKQDTPNTFMFNTDGNKTDVVFGSELKKSETFGSKLSEPTNFFTASTAINTNPTFHFNNATVSTPSTFQFNSTSTSKDIQAPLFKFGSSAVQPSGSITKPLNGQDKAMSTNLDFSAPTTSFSFGKVETPPVSSNNIFGSTVAAKNGTFNFGPNANNNTGKAVFTFGASQTHSTQPSPSFAPPSQSGFMFGTQAVSDCNTV